jgi:putative salt-induced outer membrane protein YdiY
MKKILLSIIILVSTAFAIVSIKPVEITSNDDTKLELGISYKSKSGNSDTTNVSTNIKSTFYNTNSANIMLLDYEYGESKGSKNVDKTLMHIRHIHLSNYKPLNYEIFAQVQQDTFRLIKSRYLIGFGGRYKVSLNKNGNIFYGLGVLQTKLNENKIISHFQSLNSYITYHQKLQNENKFSYNGYYQPKFENFDDYQISQKAQLTLKISKSLKFIININHVYDSNPAINIKKSDISTKTGLNYKF